MGRSARLAWARGGEAAGESAAAGESPLSLAVVGTNYRRTPVAAREALAKHLASEAVQRSLARFETITLTTCNRCEVYALGHDRSLGKAILEILASGPTTPPPEAFYVLSGDDALLHLIRVAAGLDSLAWGEPQVALQVRAAAQAGRASGRAGPVLGDLFDRALAAGGRVRQSAGVLGAPASLAGAAVRRIQDAFPDSVPNVLLVGLGKMGRLAAGRLVSKSTLFVTDRTSEKAEAFARSIGGTAVPFPESFSRLGEIDAIVVATAAEEPIITADAVPIVGRAGSRALLVIDLSVPRNVEPAIGENPGIELLDVDGLAPWVERPSDPTVIETAEAAASREVPRLSAWLRSRQAEATLADLRRAADRIRREEVHNALARLPGASDRERRVLEKMAERIVNRVLHSPTEQVRRGAAQGNGAAIENAVRELFALREKPK